jgi:hypothetical protein
LHLLTILTSIFPFIFFRSSVFFHIFLCFHLPFSYFSLKWCSLAPPSSCGNFPIYTPLVAW